MFCSLPKKVYSNRKEFHPLRLGGKFFLFIVDLFSEGMQTILTKLPCLKMWNPYHGRESVISWNEVCPPPPPPPPPPLFLKKSAAAETDFKACKQIETPCHNQHKVTRTLQNALPPLPPVWPGSLLWSRWINKHARLLSAESEPFKVNSL